jgi:TolA-binding protein
MFDVTKSKLYTQIMESVCNLLGLSAESATETEVHAALSAQPGTLAEQLENAKAGTDALAKVQELESKFSEMQTQMSGITEQLAQRDARIVELEGELQTLQTDRAAADAAATAKANEQQTKINALSGQIASLKAGLPIEAPVTDASHAAAQSGNNSASNGPIKIKSQGLASLLGLAVAQN